MKALLQCVEPDLSGDDKENYNVTSTKVNFTQIED